MHRKCHEDMFQGRDCVCASSGLGFLLCLTEGVQLWIFAQRKYATLDRNIQCNLCNLDLHTLEDSLVLHMQLRQRWVAAA